ncbi:MAG: TonB-dependent receptor plug domain-containing protein, partial [Rikenellaceae bacterium]
MGDVVVQGENKISTIQDLGSFSMNISQLKLMPSFMGEQDVFRFMQLMVGVSSGKEGSSELNIRGGSADQTQILLDDVPIYNQSHAFGLVSIFSGEAIKSAELFKGYSSPMYGGRLSGVASLYMRDGNKYEHKQALQLGTTTLSATLEGPLKRGKGSYLFSGRQFTPYLLMQGIYACLSKYNATLPQFNFYDITGKLSYDLGKNNSLYLSFYKGNDLFGSNFWNSERSYENGKVEHISKSKAGVRWGNTIASLRWNSVLGSKLFMNNIVYYSFLGNDKFSNFENYREKYNYESKIKSQMDEIGFKTNFNYSVSRGYKISYGANLSQQYFKPQITSSNRNGLTNKMDYGKRNLLTVAAYMNNEFTYRKMVFNAGLRVGMYDNSEDVVYSVEPRLSISYNIDNQSSIWVSYENNAQPLFSLNKYYFSIPIDYWIPFSGKKIQRSNQISLGYRKSFDNGLSFSSELYY